MFWFKEFDSLFKWESTTKTQSLSWGPTNPYIFDTNPSLLSSPFLKLQIVTNFIVI